MHHVPFRRAIALMSAISAILAQTAGDFAAQRMQLGKLDTYRSRGKGRGTPARNFHRSRSRYTPHQGRQECLRRRIGGWAFSQAYFGLTKREYLTTKGAA